LGIYLLAIVSAFLTTAISLPFWRRWCIRTGLVDEPGHRKIQQEPIPLAGGLAVMTGLLLPTVIAAALLWAQGATHKAAPAPMSPSPVLTSEDADQFSLLGYGLSRRALELTGILVGGLGILVLGYLDDKYELRPKTKFAGQVLIGLLVAATGARITLFIPSHFFHYVVTVLWIVTVLNAFNFMDNMNGLCAGLGAIGAWYFASLAAIDGQYLVALIAFLTLGALLGFLPYNFPKARAFLGDAGSHLVGYLLAVLAILPHFYTRHHPRRWAVLVPLLVLAIPLLDLVWVVLLRWRLGQPFYVGDTNHLSHRLVRLGLTRTQTVLSIWILAALFGAFIYFC
jgi:UDP-GlcNAc:undecaprenyl-phosphate GlcNAc-1-phosphate transferase